MSISDPGDVSQSSESPITKTQSAMPQRQELVENTGTYIYEGFAMFGKATSEAAWAIFRTTLSGSNITAIERADGDSNYDNIWDNRASLTYS